jgi:hypothetical protein
MGHDAGLATIYTPLQEHHSSLQEADYNQKPCKDFDPSLYLYVVAGLGCIELWLGGSYLSDTDGRRLRVLAIVFFRRKFEID